MWARADVSVREGDVKGPVAVLWAASRPRWCDETGWDGGSEGAYDLNAIEERDWMEFFFFFVGGEY